MKNMKGAVDCGCSFPMVNFFPIFGSQKIPGTSEFPLTKNHMFLFLCQVSPCLWGPPLRPVHPWAFCNFFQRVVFQRKGTRWRA